MAEVYLCTSPDEHLVAVKWLSQAHLPWEKRFYREIETLHILHHQNILPILDQGQEKGRPYLVMPYIDGFDGLTVGERLQQYPPSERHERCCQIGKQIATALQHIHSQGLVHRDVKPSNILFNSREEAFLIDFGTIKEFSEQEAIQTSPGQLIGTPFYAAPEQLQGEMIDERADQFALGATLYFFFLNKRVFHSLDRETPIVAPSFYDPSIPVNIEACLLRMLATDPNARFQNMQQVIEALSLGRNSGVPLAGRKHVLEQISHCIHRVDKGEKLLVRMTGPQGTGRNWAADTLYNAALRKGIHVFEIVDTRSSVIAQHRLAQSNPILLLDRYGKNNYPNIPLIQIKIHPLGLADIRRSIYAHAPKTKDLSKQAEKLHRLTGGIPALILPLLQRFTQDNFFVLPTEKPSVPEVQSFFSSIDWEDIDVLATLAITSIPLREEEIEKITMLPVKDTLSRLYQKGLCVYEGNFWRITNELFAQEAVRRAPDPDGLAKKIEEIQVLRPTIHPADERKAILLLCATGQLAQAKKNAIRLRQYTEYSSSKEEYCNALITLGQVYLDIGLWKAAEPIFADACALGKALHLSFQKDISHAYRARISLEKHNSSRSGAAAAIDRLLPLLSKDIPMVHAIWTWAIACFGDKERWRTSQHHSISLLQSAPLLEQIRGYFCLVRAAATLGETETALSYISDIKDNLKDYPFLHWEIMRAHSLLTSSPPPPTGSLAYNLEPEEIMVLKKRWIQAKGISPDPTWND